MTRGYLSTNRLLLPNIAGWSRQLPAFGYRLGHGCSRFPSAHRLSGPKEMPELELGIPVLNE